MITATDTQSTSTILTAYSSVDTGCCKIEFTEAGYTVISDDRKCRDGYLHVYEDSAESITDACRDQIIRYFFRPSTPGMRTPGIGASTQRRYWQGLSRQDIERIGNEGARVCYA